MAQLDLVIFCFIFFPLPYPPTNLCHKIGLYLYEMNPHGFQSPFCNCIRYVFPWIKIVWTWTWIITIQYIQQCVGVYGVNVLFTRHSIHFLTDTSHNHTLTHSCYTLSIIRSFIRLHSHWYQSYTDLTHDSSNHSSSSNLHRRRPTTTIHPTTHWHRYDININISYISTTITMITIIVMCHLPNHTIYTAITVPSGSWNILQIINGAIFIAIINKSEFIFNKTIIRYITYRIVITGRVISGSGWRKFGIEISVTAGTHFLAGSLIRHVRKLRTMLLFSNKTGNQVYPSDMCLCYGLLQHS